MVFDTGKITGILILVICLLYISCDQEENCLHQKSIDPIERYIQQAEDKTKTKEDRKKYLDSGLCYLYYFGR